MAVKLWTVHFMRICVANLLLIFKISEKLLFPVKARILIFLVFIIWGLLLIQIWGI